MNLPEELYTTEQCHTLDRLCTEDFGIDGFELMTRAAQSIYSQIRQSWPHACHWLIYCGAGNNAGDGYVLASLALQSGLKVTVISVCNPAGLQGSAQKAYQAFIDAGGQLRIFDYEQTPAPADVVIDALLGTGLARPVTGLMAEAILTINNQPAPVLAVDVPSGLNANTGQVQGTCVHASVTVTFIALKQGLFTGQAADYCGEIIFASLDVPSAVYAKVPAVTVRLCPPSLARRKRYSHKGDYGHVLVIGGNVGYGGAALLAGTSALRTGAGLVSLATHPDHAHFMSIYRPELMCHAITTTEQLTPLLAKASVVVIGPGLGQDEWAKALFFAVLTSDKPLIVDADALNLLALHPCQRDNWILTPHPGEAARLLACDTFSIQQDRFQAVSRLQAQYKGIAVLKGSGTLIAGDTGVGVCTRGNPGMASGGMGDTLCGIISALLAQGLSLTEAAQYGVYWHGQAGDLAAVAEGERGLLASDLLPFIRTLVN